MQKQILILLCGLPFLASASSDKSKRDCSHLMVVVDNSQRYVHPEIPRLFERLQTERFFNAITWQDYAKGRPLFARRIRSGSMGEAMLLMTLRTAKSDAGFQRRKEVITPEMGAELIIDLRPTGRGSFPIIATGGVNLHREFSAPAESFDHQVMSGNFLTSSDIRKIAERVTRSFGQSPLTSDQRIGEWSFKNQNAQMRISLDHLTHAEFASFLNALASRADERSLPDDETPGSTPP